MPTFWVCLQLNESPRTYPSHKDKKVDTTITPTMSILEKGKEREAKPKTESEAE